MKTVSLVTTHAARLLIARAEDALLAYNRTCTEGNTDDMAAARERYVNECISLHGALQYYAGVCS